jgi:hypothetical protein
MAYYFLFPESDTTLYSHPDRSSTNTGGDAILEITKEIGSSNNVLYPTRILLKFKNEEIKDVIENTIGHSNFQNTTTNLKLTSAEPKNIIQTLNLNVYAVSHSWDEGTGKYADTPKTTNGASWKYKNNTTSAQEWITSSFGSASTGSISSSLITQGGGVWHTGSGFEANQQFLVGDILDTNFNVTEIVQKHSASLFNSSVYPTGITNYGFLIKKPEVIETDVSHSFGDLNYFSTDTNTIYPPKLVFKWDDSIHTYQSSAKVEGELNVSIYNLKNEYNQNDVSKIKIHVREKYPTRTFSTTSNYLDVGYFTTSSYYSIRDAHTEQEVIPFDDNFTKISADSEGMYFKLYMKGLQPERYYRVLFKHINNDGTFIYDDDYYFKVVR